MGNNMSVPCYMLHKRLQHCMGRISKWSLNQTHEEEMTLHYDLICKNKTKVPKSKSMGIMGRYECQYSTLKLYFQN